MTVNTLLRQVRREQSATTQPGEGLYIQQFADGSGFLIKETASGDDSLLFSFHSPAELWAWLIAGPEDRRRLKARSQRRDRAEDLRVKTFLMENITERVQ